MVKGLYFKVTERFLKKIDTYLEKVNGADVRPARYKRSHLLSEAVEYFIDHDLVEKKG